ncbi:hypothetical protein Tco_0404547 [Tanacetum coccineum]
MENVEGGSTVEQITTTGDTLNTTSINVSAAGPSHVSTAGPSNVSAVGLSTSTDGDIFEDEVTNIADTLVAIRSARPRTTSVMIRNVEEEPRRATPVSTIQSQDKEQEAKDAALIEQMEDVQARMDADELLATNQSSTQEQNGNLSETHGQLHSHSTEEQDGKEDGNSQKQAESSKKRPRAEHDEESVKKQKLEDEAEREELRACLDIVPGDDIAMDFESLATKYPIIN